MSALGQKRTLESGCFMSASFTPKSGHRGRVAEEIANKIVPPAEAVGQNFAKAAMKTNAAG